MQAFSDTLATRGRHDASSLYEIRINGHLDDRWADWFEGLTLTREDNGATLLAGTIADQAALYGVLRAIRDLGVPLLSVTQVRSEPAEAPQESSYIQPSKGNGHEHHTDTIRTNPSV